MTTTTGKPVVVGFDGSDAARSALEWAVEEAHLRHLPLLVAHAFVWPVEQVYLSRAHSPTGPIEDTLRHEAEAWFAGEVEEIRRNTPGIAVTSAFDAVSPGALLRRLSADAELVVVGSRGLGGFADLVLGSVSAQVASHAASPVVVHRVSPDDSLPEAAHLRYGPVVVGVDGSAGSLAAIEFAFEEASLRELEVEAVHAWTHPVSTGPGDWAPLVMDAETVHQEARALLSEALAGMREKYPDVPVTQLVLRESAERALSDATHRASLVVVGSRGRGAVRSLLMGSTSHAVLHHATCPVAVVR